MILKFKKVILFFLPAALTLGSCTDFTNDFDANKHQYAQNFTKEFGEIDPNQDWSMAQSVQALVNYPEITGVSKLNIMTGDPHLPSTRLLAQVLLQNGKAKFSFDAIKGQNVVFVSVEQNGEYKVYRQFIINNGVLDINKEAAVAATKTLATPLTTRVGVGNVTEKGEFSSSCPTTQADAVTVTSVTHDQGTSKEGHPMLQYLSGVEQVPAAPWAMGLGYNLFGDGKVFAESVVYWDDTKKAYYGESNLETMEQGLELITDGIHPIEVPYIFGVTDYANQFGYVYWKDGEDPLTKKHFVLMEDARPEVNIYHGTYKGTYLDENGETKSTSVGPKGLGTWSAMKGADDAKDTPMRGEGAHWCNCTPGTGIWSEPYGTGAQLPLPPHDSYCATLHCYCYMPEVNGHRDDCGFGKPEKCSCSVKAFNANGTEGSGIFSSSMTHPCVNPMDTYFNEANKQVIGTSYRVMFFGEDGNATTGDYIFPEGYHIVFWIDKLGSVADLKNHTGYAPNNFNYSIPELNERIGHTSAANGKKREGGPTGLVKCITWTMDGVTYMGFGDNSGDEDLNDIVFVVNGAMPKNTVRMTTIKWHINYDGTHDETDADLFARNQYGINIAYTQPAGTPVNGVKEFLGWSTTPTGATGYSKTINATTTSTDKCYYAIWADGKVNIKWHMNLNGTHDTTDGDLYYSQKVDPNTGTYNKPTGTPTTDGKTFLGWATTPDATEPNVFLGASPADATAGDADVCYYAVWSALTPTPDPEWVSWIFACEDLGGTYDYDFNDVVWEVRKDGTSGKVQARLLAAGGTLPFTLKYNSTEILTKTSVYGAGKESTVYINQGSDWYDVLTDKSWLITDNSANFSVVLEGHGDSHIISGPTTGAPNNKEGSKAPEIILVPGNWAWPTEGTCIKDAYKDFTDWTFSANMTGWAESKQDGKTVSRQ